MSRENTELLAAALSGDLLKPLPRRQLSCIDFQYFLRLDSRTRKVGVLQAVARVLQQSAYLAFAFLLLLFQRAQAFLGEHGDTSSLLQLVLSRLRDGTLAVDASLLSYLRKRTLLSLAMDIPKYSGLQARARWTESLR